MTSGAQNGTVPFIHATGGSIEQSIARPKSASLIFPASSKLDGLMSRCIICRSCKYTSASSNWLTRSIASITGKIWIKWKMKCSTTKFPPCRVSDWCTWEWNFQHNTPLAGKQSLHLEHSIATTKYFRVPTSFECGPHSQRTVCCLPSRRTCFLIWSDKHVIE